MTIATAALVLAGLTGCSSDAEQTVLTGCEDELHLAITKTAPRPDAGWVGSEVTTRGVTVTPVESDHPVFDIHGTADVALSDSTTVTVEFDCFGQIVDGETFTSVNAIDGVCTPSAAEAGNKDCRVQ